MSTEPSHLHSKLMILGCGHSESLEHFNNNAIILTPNGNLLIDCGHTIKHALAQQSMSIEDVDSIFITHNHGDHTYGLERIAYETKFKYKKKVNLIIHEDLLEGLWNHTLKGSLGTNGDGEAVLDDYFNLTLIKDNSFTFKGICFELIKVKHTPGKSTFGLLINKKIFYSSDTIAIPDVIENLQFDVGFHDVTLSDWNPVHATLKSLSESYSTDTKKKLYLMSYEDAWRNHANTVLKNFKGFATQGMSIKI